MIAYSNQQNANIGGETGGNMFVECCNMVNGGEECTETIGDIEFPTKACDFVGLAFGMCDSFEIMSSYFNYVRNDLLILSLLMHYQINSTNQSNAYMLEWQPRH